MFRQKKPQNRPKQTPAQIVLVLIGTLVTYLFVTGCIYYALHAYWQWQYSRELGEIRRRGEPVTPADLRKPPIPESQNAAPMIMEALRKLDHQLTRDDTERLIDIASGALTGPGAASRASNAMKATSRGRPIGIPGQARSDMASFLRTLGKPAKMLAREIPDAG